METGIFYGNLKDAYPEADDPALLEKAANCGYSYVELGLDELTNKDSVFFDKARALGVGFAVYVFTDEYCVTAEGKNAAEYLNFLKGLGVRGLMAVCRPAAPYDKKKAAEAIISSLNTLCEKAAEYGITVLAEDFDSFDIPCGSCEDMMYFGNNIPLLKYTFDTGNFAFFGEDAIVCFEKLKNRISHVHLKDRVSLSDLTVTETGRGGLQIKKLIRLLAESGYDGKMTAEMFGASATEEMLKNAADFIKTALEEVL